MRSVKVFLAGKNWISCAAAIVHLRRAATENDALRGCEWHVVTVVKGEFGSAGSDRPHRSKQGADDVLTPAFKFGRVGQVALENGGQREPVRQIKGAE